MVSGANIVIEGHTDNRGDDELNRSLGVARAGGGFGASVGRHQGEVDYMRAKAEASSMADSNTRDGRSLNRRIEIRFVKRRG